MMARGSGERQRNLYVISDMSRQILERNEDRDIKVQACWKKRNLW